MIMQLKNKNCSLNKNNLDIYNYNIINKVGRDSVLYNDLLNKLNANKNE